MKTCKICKRDISIVNEDLRTEYANQADCLGMESLTEEQQLLVSGLICEECYMELE